jgi:nucleoside-diphosphate-sugar epimerase
MAKICVTGASGKAGRAVVADLLEHGHYVLATDLVAPPEDPASRCCAPTSPTSARRWKPCRAPTR